MIFNPYCNNSKNRRKIKKKEITRAPISTTTKLTGFKVG